MTGVGRATLTLHYGGGWVEEYRGELAALEETFVRGGILTDTRLHWQGEPARIAFQLAELVGEDESGPCC